MDRRIRSVHDERKTNQPIQARPRPRRRSRTQGSRGRHPPRGCLEYEYGVFHPLGGCGAVTAAMARVARELGVDIRTAEPVREILFDGRRAVGARTDAGVYRSDALLIAPRRVFAPRELASQLEKRHGGLTGVSLTPVASTDDALAEAARSPYALGASIFGPEEEAVALAGRVRAGVVVVNDVIVPTADPRLPFGGRGESGFGVTRGGEGLLELTAVKVVAVRRGRWLPHLDERRPEDAGILRGALVATHAGSLRARLAGAVTMLR